MAEFYTLLTTIGEAKVANAIALGQTIEITHLAVGDGGGTLPEPQGDEQQLINEVRRAPINTTNIDQDNPNWIVVEQIIPPQVGGWTIREIGIYDADGDLIAYGNYPPTFKPTLDQGSSRTQTVRFVLEVSNAAVVELKVDPSVVLATREYVDQQRLQHEDDREAHSASAITLDNPIDQTPESESVQEALAALGAFAADGLQNIAVFNTPGVTEWSVPEVLRLGLRNAHVTVIGGGGGGGSGEPGTGSGGGGGGGGKSQKIVDLTGATTITVTVGAGGEGALGGGVPKISGENGEVSSFGIHLSATGGSAGANSGGAGGVGVGGDINTTLGGGGSRAEGSGVGKSSGAGGGPGGQGGHGFNPSRGNNGQGPGGGGSGSLGDAAGGNGAPGIVIVRW